MPRFLAFASFALIFAAAVTLASSYAVPRHGIEVAASEAAGIRGGDCGAYQQIANGACNWAVEDSCTAYSTNCDGVCSYTCLPTTSYGGSGGTFTGSLVPGTPCDNSMQPQCTFTFCLVGGVSVPCCQCAGNSPVTCGPGPFAVNPQGCSS